MKTDLGEKVKNLEQFCKYQICVNNLPPRSEVEPTQVGPNIEVQKVENPASKTLVNFNKMSKISRRSRINKARPGTSKLTNDASFTLNIPEYLNGKDFQIQI